MSDARLRTAVAVALLGFGPALVALPAAAQSVNIWSHRITGTPPTVDGAVGPGEWPWAPQITIDASYVNPSPFESVLPDAPAYAIFAYTDTDLYILVDVVGDETADTGDECVFWINAHSTTYDLYIYGNGTTADTVGGDRAAGMGTSPNSGVNHRIYEFRIPLSALGVSVGQTVAICSPFFKSGGSMGYDPSTGHDNIWPPGLVSNDLGTWASLRLQDPGAAVPSLSFVGVAAMAVLLALIAAAALRP
jgi:hypothetical protein